MTRDELEARTREQFDAWNRQDAEGVVGFYRDDAVLVDASGQELHGREAVRAWVRTWMTALPDLHFDVARILVDGDDVAAEWRASGTHGGELMGISPTGRTTTGVGATCLTVDGDGRIVNERTYFDSLSILRDLGVVPEPEATAAS